MTDIYQVERAVLRQGKHPENIVGMEEGTQTRNCVRLWV